jgi:hypothetical protein
MAASANNKHYISEYHRTYEEASRMVQTGEAKKLIESLRPAGAIFDKDFNLNTIDAVTHRRHLDVRSLSPQQKNIPSNS